MLLNSFNFRLYLQSLPARMSKVLLFNTTYIKKKKKKNKKTPHISNNKTPRKVPSPTRKWTVEPNTYKTLKFSLCFTTRTSLVKLILDFMESPHS